MKVFGADRIGKGRLSAKDFKIIDDGGAVAWHHDNMMSVRVEVGVPESYGPDSVRPLTPEQREIVRAALSSIPDTDEA